MRSLSLNDKSTKTEKRTKFVQECSGQERLQATTLPGYQSQQNVVPVAVKKYAFLYFGPAESSAPAVLEEAVESDLFCYQDVRVGSALSLITERAHAHLADSTYDSVAYACILVSSRYQDEPTSLVTALEAKAGLFEQSFRILQPEFMSKVGLAFLRHMQHAAAVVSLIFGSDQRVCWKVLEEHLLTVIIDTEPCLYLIFPSVGFESSRDLPPQYFAISTYLDDYDALDMTELADNELVPEVVIFDLSYHTVRANEAFTLILPFTLRDVIDRCRAYCVANGFNGGTIEQIELQQNAQWTRYGLTDGPLQFTSEMTCMVDGKRTSLVRVPNLAPPQEVVVEHDAGRDYSPCYPNQRLIALNMVYRSLLVLFPELITNVNEMPNFGALKRSLFTRFDHVKFQVITHTSTSIRTQTARRIRDFGLSRHEQIHHQDVRDDLVWTWHPRFAEFEVEPEHDRFYARLKRDVENNPRTLFLIVNDECHWAISKSTESRPRPHDYMINGLSLYDNVLIVQVSATPFNILTSSSRIPEIYAGGSNPPLIRVVERPAPRGHANIEQFAVHYTGFPNEGAAFESTTGIFAATYGFDELCVLDWGFIVDREKTVWALPRDLNELPSYDGDRFSTGAYEYRSLADLARQDFHVDSEFNQRVQANHREADCLLLSEYVRSMFLLYLDYNPELSDDQARTVLNEIMQVLQNVEQMPRLAEYTQVRMLPLNQHGVRHFRDMVRNGASQTDNILRSVVERNRMVLIRVLDIRIGNAWIQILLYLRDRLDLAKRLDVVEDFGPNGHGSLADRLHPPWSNRFVAYSQADKSTVTYEDLLDIPCILVLVDRGRLGDTFPHSLYCLDFRARNVETGRNADATNTYTAIMQELGRLCQYRDPNEEERPHALLGARLYNTLDLGNNQELNDNRYFDGVRLSVNEYMKRRGNVEHRRIRANYREQVPDDTRALPSSLFRSLFQPVANKSYDSRSGRDFHNRRIVLSAQPQIGKTGAYLRYIRYFVDLFNTRDQQDEHSVVIPIYNVTVDQTLRGFWLAPRPDVFSGQPPLELSNLRNGKYGKRLQGLRLLCLIEACADLEDGHQWLARYRDNIVATFSPGDRQFSEGLLYDCVENMFQEFTMKEPPVRRLNFGAFKLNDITTEELDRVLNWDGTLSHLIGSSYENYRGDAYRVVSQLFSYADLYHRRGENVASQTREEAVVEDDLDDGEVRPTELVNISAQALPHLSAQSVNTAASNVQNVEWYRFMSPIFRSSDNRAGPVIMYGQNEFMDRLFNFDGRELLSVKPGLSQEFYWLFQPSIKAAAVGLFDYSATITSEYVQIIVVRQEEVEEYRALLRSCNRRIIIVLPNVIDMSFLSNDIQPGWTENMFRYDYHSIGYARLFIQLFSYFLKLSFVWMIDDNVAEFRELDLMALARDSRHSRECPPMVCGMETVLHSLEAIVGKQMFNDQDLQDLTAAYGAPPTILPVRTGYEGAFPSYMDCNRVGIVGIHRDWPSFMRIKRPFLNSLSIYSMYMINVQATVAAKVYYLPKHLHEDIWFTREAHRHGLHVIKCNRFFHRKNNFQVRQQQEIDPEPQIEQNNGAMIQVDLDKTNMPHEEVVAIDVVQPSIHERVLLHWLERQQELEAMQIQLYFFDMASFPTLRKHARFEVIQNNNEGDPNVPVVACFPNLNDSFMRGPFLKRVFDIFGSRKIVYVVAIRGMLPENNDRRELIHTLYYSSPSNYEAGQWDEHTVFVMKRILTEDV